MKIWGTVECRAWYTRTLTANTIERKAKGIIATYTHPYRKGKDENIAVKIPYSAIRYMAKRGPESYAVTYVVEEWTGKESISERPVLDEATGLIRCKSSIKGTTFFVNSARFERNGKPWSLDE